MNGHDFTPRATRCPDCFGSGIIEDIGPYYGMDCLHCGGAGAVQCERDSEENVSRRETVSTPKECEP